jgi:uncharacterized membrane protein YeaQ/YmgE (transglycosylase-associated protein family)
MRRPVRVALALSPPGPATITLCADGRRVSFETRANILTGKERTMGIISWIVLGAIAGFLANMIVGGNEGVIGTIVLGIVGALVGGFLAATLFDKGDVSGVNIESIVIAVIGAIVVLFVWRAVFKNRSSRPS